MKLKKLYLEPPTNVLAPKRGDKRKLHEKTWRVWCQGRFVGFIKKWQGKNFPYFTFELWRSYNTDRPEHVLHVDGVYRFDKEAKIVKPKEYDSLKECQQAFRDSLEKELLFYFIK